MEKDHTRKNSRQVAGETDRVAEGKKRAVAIPVILEIAKVDVEVAVGVRVHVRNPVVTVGLYAQWALYDAPPIPPKAAPAAFCILSRAILLLDSAPHRLYYFFAQGDTHPQDIGIPDELLAYTPARDFDGAKP